MLGQLQMNECPQRLLTIDDFRPNRSPAYSCASHDGMCAEKLGSNFQREFGRGWLAFDLRSSEDPETQIAACSLWLVVWRVGSPANITVQQFSTTFHTSAPKTGQTIIEGR